MLTFCRVWPAGAIIAALVLHTSNADALTFQGIGDLPGGATFSAVSGGLSADGSVVVDFSKSALGDEAFLWTSAGGMIGLGDLPGGGFSSYASGISADGSTVVGSSSGEKGGEAFLWTSAGGMAGLGDLPGGAFLSSASDISANGSTVVGFSAIAAGYEAFRWTSSGGMAGLGNFAGANFGSRATGVSSDGSVVVGGIEGLSPFRWTSSGGMTGLGDQPGIANGVSADGSTIVGTINGAAGEEAFRWTNTDGIVGLGGLHSGYVSSGALSVSGNGSLIVGSSSIDGSSLEAFVWDASHGMQSLSSLLTASGIDLSGWNLMQATAINADGTAIAGTGTHYGNTEAWLITGFSPVPEPGGFAFLVCGGLGILLIRRKCRRTSTPID